MLLFYEKPYKDESISSLVYRTASTNLMENLDWIFENLSSCSGIRANQNTINWLSDVELSILMRFLKIQGNDLKELNFTNLLTKLNLSYSELSTNHWFQYMYSKFCPLCLIEKCYQKVDWMSSFSIICLEHKSFLLDQCQHCKRLVSSKQIILNKCICGNMLSNNIPKFVIDNNLINFQQNINQIIYYNTLSLNNHLVKDGNTFLEALLFFCTWSSQLLSSKSLSIPKYNIIFNSNTLAGTRLKNTLKVEQTICLVNYAFDTINTWPNGYYKFLEEISINNSKKFKTFIKNIVPILKNSIINEVSNELTEYYKIKLSIPEEQNYYRPDQIYSNADTLTKNLLYSNLVPYFEYNHNGVHIRLMADEDINIKRIEVEKSISKEKLLIRWNTSPKATLNILNSGIIKNAISYKMGSVGNWLIPIESIIEIERELFSYSEKLSGEIIPLNAAIQWVGVERASDIFKGILNKEISYSFDANKISKITLSKQECYFYMNDIINKQASLDKQLDIRDLIFLLGVKNSDIIYWVNTGRFGSKCSISNCEKLPYNYYLNFKANYLTTFQVSITYNIPISTLLKKVQIGKLEVLSGPKLNDGKRILFEKNSQIFQVENSV